jgi:hypothetical protein
MNVNGTSDTVFTYSFDRSTTPITPSGIVKYIVEHYKANSDGSYPTDPTDTEILSGKIGDTVTAAAKKYDGYCLNPNAEGTVSSAVLVSIEDSDGIVVLKLYYDTDIAGGGENGDQPDEIPDKYQKKLIFKVVNGTWDGTKTADIIKYVTLMTDGKWDANGSAIVDDKIVPVGMIANSGFENGAWDVTFPMNVIDTSDVTYTFTFVAKPVVNPDTADNGSLLFWLASVSVCVACICLISVRRRKKTEGNK